MTPDHAINLFVLLLGLAGVGAGVLTAVSLMPRVIR